MENLSKESLEYVEFMIDMFCDGFEGDGEVRFNINRDEYGDSDLYSSVISLATVMPNAAPLCEIKSSHKDTIDSKSFFLIFLILKSF